MNALILLAHPEPRSFNAGMAERAAEALSRAGHAARISDLYARGFDARVSRADFAGAKDPDYLRVIPEQANAFKTDGFAGDVAREIEDLKWAELLVLQFPLWWFGMPAILKGWMDRVLVPGLTYGRGKWYETGGMAGRRAVVSTTVDAKAAGYGPRGRYGSLDVVLWPVHQSLRFVGYDVLAPQLTCEVSVSEEARKAGLDAWGGRVAGLRDEEPLFFHPLEDYGDDDALKPGVAPRTVAQREGR